MLGHQIADTETLKATCLWPPQMMNLLAWIGKAIQSMPLSAFKPTEFQFKLTIEAAWHNYRILEKHDFNLPPF
jgi:hypothetical protein